MESLQRECPAILLASGQIVKLRQVLLYEEDRVNEIALLKAQAAKSLGGVSSGIGFWGSPGWVLGGAAALGLVEGLLSSSAKKQGLETLQTAVAKAQELANKALYFDAAQLGNAHRPYPHMWFASVGHVVDMSQVGWVERSALLSKYQKSKSDIVENQLHVERRYIHDGDEFVHVNTDSGIASVRWSHVVAYFPAQQPRAPQDSLTLSQ